MALRPILIGHLIHLELTFRSHFHYIKVHIHNRSTQVKTKANQYFITNQNEIRYIGLSCTIGYTCIHNITDLTLTIHYILAWVFTAPRSYYDQPQILKPHIITHQTQSDNLVSKYNNAWFDFPISFRIPNHSIITSIGHT